MTDAVLAAQLRCRALHTGLWAVLPSFLESSVAAVNRGYRGEGPYEFLAREDHNLEIQQGEPRSTEGVQAQGGGRAFQLDRGGIAVIGLSGPMLKGRSKFPHVNTVAVRRSLRAAVEDPEVDGILLVVDSPGGSVAGTEELARDIATAGARKPLRVHADDLMASASYWAASSASRITAGTTAEVGSIGTVAVIEDSSREQERAGVVVHVVSTGAHKGALTPGAPVTPEHLAEVQRRVNAFNAHFLDAVRAGRGLDGEALERVADGRVFMAAEARELGLVDDVMPLGQAVEEFRQALQDGRSRRRATARTQELSAELKTARLRAELDW